MPLDFKTEAKKGYLYVDLLENSVITDEIQKFVAGLGNTVQKSDYNKIMINVNTSLIPKSRERTFDIVEMLNVNLSHYKIAVVYHEKMFSELKFFENVAVNQGICLNVFFDKTSAEDWLLG